MIQILINSYKTLTEPVSKSPAWNNYFIHFLRAVAILLNTRLLRFYIFPRPLI